MKKKPHGAKNNKPYAPLATLPTPPKPKIQNKRMMHYGYTPKTHVHHFEGQALPTTKPIFISGSQKSMQDDEWIEDDPVVLDPIEEGDDDGHDDHKGDPRPNCAAGPEVWCRDPKSFKACLKQTGLKPRDMAKVCASVRKEDLDLDDATLEQLRRRLREFKKGQCRHCGAKVFLAENMVFNVSKSGGGYGGNGKGYKGGKGNGKGGYHGEHRCAGCDAHPEGQAQLHPAQKQQIRTKVAQAVAAAAGMSQSTGATRRRRQAAAKYRVAQRNGGGHGVYGNKGYQPHKKTTKGCTSCKTPSSMNVAGSRSARYRTGGYVPPAVQQKAKQNASASKSKSTGKKSKRVSSTHPTSSARKSYRSGKKSGRKSSRSGRQRRRTAQSSARRSRRTAPRAGRGTMAARNAKGQASVGQKILQSLMRSQ